MKNLRTWIIDVQLLLWLYFWDPPRQLLWKGSCWLKASFPRAKTSCFPFHQSFAFNCQSCLVAIGCIFARSLFLYNVSPNPILWVSMATEIILLITCWWKKQSTFGVCCAWGKISDPDLTTNLAKHFFGHESCFSRGFHDLCELFLQKNDKMLGARA